MVIFNSYICNKLPEGMRIFEATNSQASTMAIDVLDCAGEAGANVSGLASTSTMATMADPC